MSTTNNSERGWPAAREFRSVLGHFCSGLTVITTVADGRPAGLTCQSFFSLSLDPPLVAFSVSKTSTTYPALRDTGVCCVNVLAGNQRALSDGFARSGTDKWAGVAWSPGEATGSPVLDGALAWLECELQDEYETGDHLLAVARVRAVHSSQEGGPLLYFKGAYAHLGDSQVTA
ncbi:flavin reductase family protein [Streptomyces umbrinus]|uniref:flavin reductase family protein n=1 Tax=Streptomyces umbrinus TaxID=67370 RepID=UPI003C2DE836